jgi:hypothetical protein
LSSSGYPGVTVSDLVRHAPDLLLLPSEPYAFSDAQAAELAAALPRCDYGRSPR